MSILSISTPMVARSTILILRVRSDSTFFLIIDVLLEYFTNMNVYNIRLKTSDHYIMISS